METRLAFVLAVALLAPMENAAQAQDVPGSVLPAPPSPSPAAESTAAPLDHAGYSYDYALYDGRYDDFIVSLDAYKPFGKRAPIRPFFGASLVRDSRTGSGNVPLIFSDNYVVGGAGLQYTDGSGLRVFGQVGVSATVGPVAAVPSGGDLRGGVQYYRSFGPQDASHHGYGNFYGSTTYYSRYSDWVLYTQTEAVSNVGGAVRPLELFVRPVLTLDTRRHYYDNLVEAGAGIRYRPFGKSGPSLAVEEAAGVYLRGAVRPAGEGPLYTDFRPAISYGFSL